MRFPGQVFAILLTVVCAVGCKKEISDAAYRQTLDIQIDPASIESGTTASIMVSVKEAMLPKSGVKVTFSASGNCGTLSATTATTQTGQTIGLAGDGQAVVTFKGNSPYSTCSAIITASAKDSKTSMITVMPQGVTRTAPDSVVPPGGTAPSVEVTPDVALPVNNGFSATYSITATNANIDSIHIVTSQKATISTQNGAVPPGGSAATNTKDVFLTEPAANDFTSDVVTISSESLRLGKLQMTVILKNPFGQDKPIELTFTGVLPGPG